MMAMMVMMPMHGVQVVGWMKRQVQDGVRKEVFKAVEKKKQHLLVPWR